MANYCMLFTQETYLSSGLSGCGSLNILSPITGVQKD